MVLAVFKGLRPTGAGADAEQQRRLEIEARGAAEAAGRSGICGG